MPDILIRGMDKPGGCRECDFCEAQDINFETLYFCNRNDRFLDDEEVCNIPSDCPIIELPEHGDLISKRDMENVVGEPLETFLSRLDLRCPPVIVSGNKEESE